MLMRVFSLVVRIGKPGCSVNKPQCLAMPKPHVPPGRQSKNLILIVKWNCRADEAKFSVKPEMSE